MPSSFTRKMECSRMVNLTMRHRCTQDKRLSWQQRLRLKSDQRLKKLQVSFYANKLEIPNSKTAFTNPALLLPKQLNEKPLLQSTKVLQSSPPLLAPSSLHRFQDCNLIYSRVWQHHLCNQISIKTRANQQPHRLLSKQFLFQPPIHQKIIPL